MRYSSFILLVWNLLLEIGLINHMMMLQFIELEGLAFLALAIYIIYRSKRPEQGLWRITASRVNKLRK